MPGWIRAVHPYAFRSGDWAKIRETAELPVRTGWPELRADRACYLIEFGDGVTDFWPLEDPAAWYEFLMGPVA